MTNEEFRERIRANWTDAQTVDAWRRWHEKIKIQLSSVSSALINAAGISRGMRVLDIASGSGEPALEIAGIVAPTGSVTATDLSVGMLDVARENAKAQRLANLEFVVCDVENLPFPDNSFDAVTSRMAAMFFVDVQRSLAEIRRVLRPGGRVALAAWGPLERLLLFHAFIAPFLQRVTPPAPPPGAPHPFRFAPPGSLSSELAFAQFSDVREEIPELATPWPGSPEDAWAMFYELAAPPFVDELPDEERNAAISEGLAAARALYDGNTITATAAIVIASGRKPQ